jgi:hypothetical protein
MSKRRLDFVEVYSHYSMLELVRDRLEPQGYEVYPKRQLDSGRGTIMVRRGGNTTAIPYHLPEDLDRIEKLLRSIPSTVQFHENVASPERDWRHCEQR